MSGLPPGQPRQRALLQWLRHPAHRGGHGGRAADLHAGTHRRQDPHLARRHGRRAQASHRALRRSQGLDGAPRRPRSRGSPPAARRGPGADDGGGPPLRGHREPGDGRRHHGPVRRAPRHEDHAVRACYAALRMQETVGRYAEVIQKTEGISVRIRVGLNSGEVVVRSIGSDLKMDYTAVGQTTHLAARMEQMADPGTIIVAPSTLRLAEGAVQVAALGARPIKGLDAPIEVSELVGGASARSKVRSTDGQQLSRFIGRGAELERLHALPELARAGQGQVAAVSSEAGLGKTRLLYEFLHSAKTQPWRILEGRSHSYERAASYRPIIELLRAYFELDALDPASRVTEKVAATIRDLDPGPGDAVAPLLSLLDVLPSDDPFRGLDARERHERVG